jgi:hypothetical protein
MTSLEDENQMMVCKKEKKEGGYRRHNRTRRIYVVQYCPRDDHTDLVMCSTVQGTIVPIVG